MMSFFKEREIMTKTLLEYQEEILKLDADIANLSVKRDRLRREVCKEFFPQYVSGTKIICNLRGKFYYGKIISAELDKRNPFRVRVEMKPTTKNFDKINRAVVHPVFIDSSEIKQIVN